MEGGRPWVELEGAGEWPLNVEEAGEAASHRACGLWGHLILKVIGNHWRQET